MNKLSLCMIVGNVEEYIERCLRSFAPIADEFSIVRAIGSKEPDQTMAIVERVARELKIPLGWSEYKNKPGHEDWPHTDSFAAARQQSFDKASHDYVFWCDSDDLLESGADIVRQHLADASYAAYVFPYRILIQNIVVPRERMMLRSAGKWRWPVHECFEFTVENTVAFEDERVVITHMPRLTKEKDSHSRNMRIMRSIPESEMTGGMWYHMACELEAMNQIPEATEAAKKAFEDPELGKPERYELFMLMSRRAADPNMKAQLLHGAFAADPTRREALYLLASNSMDHGRGEEALAYSRQMMATLKPRETAWTDRSAVYSWAGADIYCQALRCTGNWKLAEDIRVKTLRDMGGPRISLVHATRGRPERAAMARKLWFDLADKPEQVEHVFAIDLDDKESYALRRMHHVTIDIPGAGCVGAWNIGSGTTQGDVIVQMSDDFVPPEKWDKLILERIGDVKQPKVLAVSDGLRPDRLLCMAIITRPYLFKDFFVLHPDFTGVYSDDWFTELAYRRGAVIEARDLVFHHDHPVLHGKWDETYIKQNAPERYEHGKKILNRLMEGRDWSDCHGWFNFYPFYQRVAAALKDGDTFCEVGSWQGRSICYLAQRLQFLGKKVNLISVDTFKGDQDVEEHLQRCGEVGGSVRGLFDANLERCGVADMVRVIEGDSAESADLLEDGSLAGVFIDASHDYNSAKRDVLAWQPKVRADGILAGHDADHEPVALAVKEVLGGKSHTFGNVWIRKN